MNLSIGIVGLPNVGKSTLFNALLKRQQALVANYPFATIEPNIGVVAVPDERLLKLAEITRDEEKMLDLPPIKPAVVNFVDIAGLVKGASEGAGLGNKFLSHIREVSVIAHAVRGFSDPDIIREGSVGIREDWETVNTELALADIQTLQKILENRKIEPERKAAAEKLLSGLNSGKMSRDIDLSDKEKESIRDLFLLTAKPEIIVLNVAESDIQNSNQLIIQYANQLNVSPEKFVVISAKIEAELASLTEEEQAEYLKELGLSSSGLERLIQKAYEELGLISFLTCGVKEVRAWTIVRGSTAVLAAGEIHTDFMKKFIKAEVVHYPDFVEFEGWRNSREHGKALLEGRDYIVQDGDVIEFKIGT